MQGLKLIFKENTYLSTTDLGVHGLHMTYTGTYSASIFCCVLQVESGGTVLSTNWGEVGEKKVEMKPPDGMEWKKYDD